MLKKLIQLAEKGILPDRLIRLGINHLNRIRLKQAKVLGPEEVSIKHQEWVEKLKDCEIQYIDIAADAAAQAEWEIVVVPTILIFNGEEEVGRFQANIMMKMEATQEEVQEKIDEIIMESF